MSCRAEELTLKASKICAVVHCECSRRALEINYTKGKTELLLSFAGKGADKARQSLVRCPEGIAFSCGDRMLNVRRTCKYTHLGTVLPDTATAGPDLRRKLARAKGYLRPLAKHVLRHPQLDLRCKHDIYQALGANVAHYNVAVWSDLSGEETRTWVQGHDAMYRLLLPEDRHTRKPKHPTIYEVCGATRLAVPQAKLSALRILHAERLVRQDLDPVWDLLSIEDSASSVSWLDTLRRDLIWLTEWVSSLQSTNFADMCPDALAAWFSERSLKPLDHWSTRHFKLNAKPCLDGINGSGSSASRDAW